MTTCCADPIVELVVAKLRKRCDLGLKKYGVSLWDSPESVLAFLRHAQSEALDYANYLEVLIQRAERGESLFAVVDASAMEPVTTPDLEEEKVREADDVEDDGFVTIHVTGRGDG